jgi:hypothetical protein
MGCSDGCVKIHRPPEGVILQVRALVRALCPYADAAA